MPWDSNSTWNESLTAASSSMTYTIGFDTIDLLHIWGNHIPDAVRAHVNRLCRKAQRVLLAITTRCSRLSGNACYIVTILIQNVRLQISAIHHLVVPTLPARQYPSIC